MNKLPKPASKLGRTLLGSALIVGGLLGFLPILGFWMLPLGLIMLSHDFSTVRRFRRKWVIIIGRWWKRLKAK